MCAIKLVPGPSYCILHEASIQSPGLEASLSSTCGMEYQKHAPAQRADSPSAAAQLEHLQQPAAHLAAIQSGKVQPQRCHQGPLSLRRGSVASGGDHPDPVGGMPHDCCHCFQCLF